VVIKAPNSQQMVSLSIPAVDKTVKIRKIINIREDELTSDDNSASLSDNESTEQSASSSDNELIEQSASSSDNELTEQSAVDKGRPIKIKRLLNMNASKKCENYFL